MSNKLKHADVIVHMAQNGFNSVEGRCSADDFWQDATSSSNPTRFPNYQWRIKSTTFEYTVKVELPMQVKPEIGKEYWYVDLYDVTPTNWDNKSFDNKIFDSGNIWDSRAKAQAVEQRPKSSITQAIRHAALGDLCVYELEWLICNSFAPFEDWVSEETQCRTFMLLVAEALES